MIVAPNGGSSEITKDIDASRIDREREYHNERFTAELRSSQWKYYWAVESGLRQYLASVRQASEGADILELGCGLGLNILQSEAKFSSATGVDISDVGVRKAKEHAAALGLTNARFICGDAQDTGLPGSSFDLIYGSGIIHHLNIASCAQEVRRLLKSGGSAIFWEPLGHNPIINLYRHLTPSARTADEQPLRKSHFAKLQEIFPKTETTFFGFATLAMVPFRKSLAGGSLLRTAQIFDRVALSLPGVKWGAWFALIKLSKE